MKYREESQSQFQCKFVVLIVKSLNLSLFIQQAASVLAILSSTILQDIVGLFMVFEPTDDTLALIYIEERSGILSKTLS